MLVRMKKVTCISICLVFVLLLIAATPVKADTQREIGIATSASLIGLSDTDLENRLNDIESLGADWIRVDFSWYFVQPDNASDYNWEQHDRIVEAAGKHNLKVLALLNYTPKWARDSRCDSAAVDEAAARKCAPRSIDEFGRFAAVAARRYENKNIRAWEIWNEPNLTAYWKTVQPDGTLSADPIEYARLANMAATQMRYHTDATIITGGLAPLFEPQPSTGIRQSDYLAKILMHLNPDIFDGISVHPYTWPLLPTRAAEFNAFYTIDNGNSDYNLRTIMTEAGWGDKQIWGTEFGASTKGLRGDGYANWKDHRPDHVSEFKQAIIIEQGIEGWYHKSNVGPLFVHSDSDQWLHEQTNEGGFGLRRDNGIEKPAYDAFKSATQRLQSK